MPQRRGLHRAARDDAPTARIRFTVPSPPAGVDVDGVELTFRDGEVVDGARRARRGLPARARWPPTTARARLGEIGIGTNFGIDRPTGTILFDEKIGGTVHLALGRSIRRPAARTRPRVHWDLICDLRAGGRLTADGELIQANGRFVL